MKSTALLSIVVLGAGLGGARADTPAPADTGTDQLTLPKGRFVLDAFLEASLSKDAVFKPFSIAPDLWYGVTDALTVGIVHSVNGEIGFIGGTGSSLCLSGSDNGCPHVYQNAGADVRYRLVEGNLTAAFDGGLYFHSFDPVELAAKVGFVGRWRQDRLVIEAEPAIVVGLTNRETTLLGETVTQNGDYFTLPVTGLYSIDAKLALALQTGLILPFQHTGDTWSLPLSAGVHYLVTEKLNLTAAFTLTRLAGGSSADAFDGRSLTIGGSYAL